MQLPKVTTTEALHTVGRALRSAKDWAINALWSPGGPLKMFSLENMRRWADEAELRLDYPSKYFGLDKMDSNSVDGADTWLWEAHNRQVFDCIDVRADWKVLTSDWRHPIHEACEHQWIPIQDEELGEIYRQVFWDAARIELESFQRYLDGLEEDAEARVANEAFDGGEFSRY